MERVVRLEGFQWTENQVMGSVIAIYDFPGAIVNKSTFLQDKLKDFLYLRCDVEVSVRLNGTAFHYGKLLFSWDPMYRCMEQGSLDRVSNLYTASGGPFIIVSPSENKVVTFTIPFIFPYYYLMLSWVGNPSTAEYVSMGALRVFVLNPLRQYSTAPSNPVGVTIFARMFNVSVQGYGPTAVGEYTFPNLPLPTVNTFPTPNTMTNLSFMNEEIFHPQVMGSLTDPNAVTPSPGRFMPARVAAVGKNLVQKGKGFAERMKRAISKPRDPEAASKSRAKTTARRTEKASKFFEKLSKIPVVGKFAKVAQVATKIIGKVAEKIKAGRSRRKARRAKRRGRTRPNTESTEENVVPRLFNLAHTHGLNNGPILGLWSDSIIDEHFDFIGSHEDEMDLDYICSTPSLGGFLEWTSSTLEGEPLTTSWVPVTPVIGDTTTATVHSTLLGWVALPFRYWRGSIRVMIQVTCSSFHAGRLAVVWLPSEGRESQTMWYPPPLDKIFDKVSSRIIDIKSECEIGITFPYFSMKPWLLTAPMSNTNSTSAYTSSPTNVRPGSPDEYLNSGYFAVYVVNRLTHSENPVPPVMLNFWFSGGEDFQLAMPTNASLTNTPFGDIGDMEPQSSFMREDIRSAEYTPILDMSTIPDLGIAVPEAPIHLKDVLMRFTRTQILADDDDLIIFNPLATWDSPEYNSTPMPFYIWYESIFRFRRGSFDIKCTWTDNSPNEIPRYLALDVQPVRGFIDNNPGTWLKKSGTNSIAENSLLSQGATMVKEPVSNSLEGTIPYYNNTLCDIVGKVRSSDFFNSMVRSTGVIGQVGGTGNVTLQLYVSAGDSYNLGFITGAPSTRNRAL